MTKRAWKNAEKPARTLHVRNERSGGDYGKAVEGVYRSFRELGMTNVNIKLYEDDRHELVNESDREMVWKDIYEWVQAHRVR